MIVETSQDTIDLSFDSKATNILVKVSGGLDSAIVL